MHNMVHARYMSLMDVERDFRTMRNGLLELRPRLTQPAWDKFLLSNDKLLDLQSPTWGKVARARSSAASRREGADGRGFRRGVARVLYEPRGFIL